MYFLDFISVFLSKLHYLFSSTVLSQLDSAANSRFH